MSTFWGQDHATALGQLGDPAAHRALEHVLTDSDPRVRGAAATALGQLGDPAARPSLEHALTDSDLIVQENAIEALGQIGDPAAKPALDRVLKESGYFDETVIEALRAISKKGECRFFPDGRTEPLP